MSDFFLPIALVLISLFFHLILKQLRLINEVLCKIDESVFRSNMLHEQMVDICELEGEKSSQLLIDHKEMLETSKYDGDLRFDRTNSALENIKQAIEGSQSWQISIHEFLKEMNQKNCKKPKKAASPSKDPS